MEPDTPSPVDTPPARIGRPPVYSEELAAEVCRRVAEGESLRSVCRDPEMPSGSTVWKWQSTNPGFAKQYAQAREALYRVWADEVLSIADDGTTDYQLKVGRNGREYMAVDQEHIQRSRLRVDTRRWLLSKLLPKVYGDRVEHQHGGEVTVQHELSEREIVRRLAYFMAEDKAAGVTLELEPTPAGEAEPGPGDSSKPEA